MQTKKFVAVAQTAKARVYRTINAYSSIEMNISSAELTTYQSKVSCNPNNINARDATTVNQGKTNRLNQLAKAAARSEKLYGWGSYELVGSAGTVYGFTQCTRDVYSFDSFGLS
ncbi:hypothetical protein SLA2020_436750 [Shorea laevis]